jgi:hypothetical protein
MTHVAFRESTSVLIYDVRILRITGIMDNRVIILNRKLKLIVRRRPRGRTFSVHGYIVFDLNITTNIE